MLVRWFHISIWLGSLVVPFIISVIVIFAISGRKHLARPTVYPIRLAAALLIAIGMGAYIDSPWLGSLLVSAATGLLFRYW